ncbi:MAG TPA: hydrogenase, partial [Thermoanaerobaculia bacterium]|nr:hydrogenase [Thermoanaerobaculia bacterium]
ERRYVMVSTEQPTSAEQLTSDAKGPRMDVLVYVQALGYRTFHEDELAGTNGLGLRLEGFQLNINPPVPNLSLRYMAHLEDTGDTPFKNEGEFAGTPGKRLEGFAIELTGDAAPRFDVVYMANIEELGDTPLVTNGVFCGTRFESRRIERILVRIDPK